MAWASCGYCDALSFPILRRLNLSLALATKIPDYSLARSLIAFGLLPGARTFNHPLASLVNCAMNWPMKLKNSQERQSSDHNGMRPAGNRQGPWGRIGCHSPTSCRTLVMARATQAAPRSPSHSPPRAWRSAVQRGAGRGLCERPLRRPRLRPKRRDGRS